MNKITYQNYLPKTKKMPPQQSLASTTSQLKQISGMFQTITFLFPLRDNDVQKY